MHNFQLCRAWLLQLKPLSPLVEREGPNDNIVICRCQCRSNKWTHPENPLPHQSQWMTCLVILMISVWSWNTYFTWKFKGFNQWDTDTYQETFNYINRQFWDNEQGGIVLRSHNSYWKLQVVWNYNSIIQIITYTTLEVLLHFLIPWHVRWHIFSFFQ